MTDSERESVKSHFANFNTELQSILTVHKTLSIADKVMYEAIIKEIKESVVQSYTKFYNTWVVTCWQTFGHFWTPPNQIRVVHHLQIPDRILYGMYSEYSKEVVLSFFIDCIVDFFA